MFSGDQSWDFVGVNSDRGQAGEAGFSDVAGGEDNGGEVG